MNATDAKTLLAEIKSGGRDHAALHPDRSHTEYCAVIEAHSAYRWNTGEYGNAQQVWNWLQSCATK